MTSYLTQKAETKRWWDIPVIAGSVLLAVTGAEVSVEDIAKGEPVSSTLAGVIVVGIMLIPLYRVVRHRLRQADARKIAKAFDLCRDDSIPLHELEKRSSVKNADIKVKQLLSAGYLQNIAIDVDRDCVRLVKPWNAASPSQQAILDTGNAEFDARLAELRKLNDEIKNWKVSNKIDRIEQLSASIFQVIDQKPERAGDARRFMNYYLPTTMKLLESYKLMEQQSYQGENIQESRAKIEAVLDTMINAMEGTQDKLFKFDVLDVESDITVLETLMAADGLSEHYKLPSN